jgi:hypothetical protein
MRSLAVVSLVNMLLVAAFLASLVPLLR